MSDTQDFVRNALSGNAVEAQSDFDAIVRGKIADRLDARREEISSALFGQSTDLPEPEGSDEPEGEDQDDEE